MKPLRTLCFLFTIMVIACTQSVPPSPESSAENATAEDWYWVRIDSVNSLRVLPKFIELKRLLANGHDQAHVFAGDTTYTFSLDTTYAPYRGTRLAIQIGYPDCRNEQVLIETYEYADPPLIGGESNSGYCQDTVVVWTGKEQFPSKAESVLDASLKVMSRQTDTIPMRGPTTKKV